MADELSGLRVAYLTSDAGLEEVELTTPGPASTPQDAGHAYYGAVVVRGGVTDADLLRTASAAVSSVHELSDSDRPVAGQRVLVDVVRGQTRTPWPSMQTDVENAGGSWVETSGKPHDSFWTTLSRVFSHRSSAA